jgi:hypothetical protein
LEVSASGQNGLALQMLESGFRVLLGFLDIIMKLGFCILWVFGRKSQVWLLTGWNLVMPSKEI